MTATLGRAPARAGAPTLVLAGALAVTTVVHLAAQIAGAHDVADVSQWLLMPLLAGVLLAAAGAARRTRLVRLWTLGLALSWLGDTAPDLVDDDLSFIVMLGFFLLGHVAYLAALWPLRREGVLVRRPWLLVPYAVLVVALVAVCAPGAGGLLGPVVVYAATLTAMAVLATFDVRAALGGVLFLASDALIAMRAFVPGYDLAGQGFWVMSTYVAAQVLLVAGVLRVASRATNPSAGA